MTGRRGRRYKRLLNDFKEKRILGIEGGSIRSPSAENLFWKRLWACHKSDNRMNE